MKSSLRWFVHFMVFAVFAAGCSSSLLKPQATSPARAEVVGVAGAQIGKAYKYDGADHYGFDDSGLVYFSFSTAGFELPRDVEGQLRVGDSIDFFNKKPGDLLFYKLKPTQSGNDDGLHVGIYVGDGKMVHAPLQRDQVVLETIDNPYWMQRLVGTVKILP